MRKLLVGFGLVLLGWAVNASAQAPEPLPTQAEVQTLVDTGNYQEALKKLIRLLALSGRAAEGYDRCGLWMLKGEAQLQMKMQTQAMDSFTQARKEARSDDAAATALATAELIRRSSNYVYSPKVKTPTPTSYNVLDRGVRKSAFAAMFEEDFGALAPKIELAKRVTSLTDLLNLGQAILPLRAEELAGLGNNDKTKEALKVLGGHARDLVTTAVTNMERSTATIENQANQILTRMVPDPNNPKVSQMQTVKRGLDGNMLAGLNDTIATCEKLPVAVKMLAGTLSLEPGPFNDALLRAARLQGRALGVRDADYGNQPNTVRIR